MSQRVQIVRGVGFAITLDILDHLAPDCEVTLNREIESGEIKLGNLIHIFKFKDFEGEHEITCSPIMGDADTEGSVDEAQTPEACLLRGHLAFEGIEKLG